MRGRGIVAVLLVGFVLVATGVIWRRSLGLQRARETAALEARRVALEARRAQLDGEIRDATSRARLARIAEERLGMRVPADSQVITLTRPRRPDAPR